MAEDEPATVEEVAHMQWLVANRSLNQVSALKLHNLLTKHESQWGSDTKLLYASQSMVGASFSLWRAVFLGDKTGDPAHVVRHSIEFLGSMILDNAITYAVDKKNNEWTFNYYVESSRLRLVYLIALWPDLLEPWNSKKRAPRKRWEYNQKRLDDAIEKFEKHLSKK